MTALIALWALGVLHAGFAGIREASGLNLRIEKRAYFAWAMVRGVVVGQVASAIIIAVLVSIWLGEGDAIFESLGRGATASLIVYVPYTSVVLLTFVPYFIRNPELRSLTMVLVFGPLTLALPFVIFAGTIAGVVAAPTSETGIVLGTGALVISLVEPALVLLRWSRRAADIEHERGS